MKALWLDNRSLVYRDGQPMPPLPAGEALVKLRLAGICATDLELLRGYYPYTGIPGHEFVGEVVFAPEPSWEGQRVVGEINATCGECGSCRGGRPTHCERRTVLGIANRNGVFSEFFHLPLANLHRVPDSIPDEAAVFTEPLAAALEIQQQAHIQPGDRVLVVGAGRLGQLIARTLFLTGCEMVVAARHSRQVKLLAGRGIRTVAPEEIPVAGMDIVVEATGSPGGFELARRALRPRGTLVLKSTYAGNLEVNFSSIVVDEITLIGSRCGPFPPALNLLQARLVDPAPLIDACYPLSQGIAAFEHAGRPGAMKILLEPG